MIAPNGTLRIARRMLSASREIAAAMPPGFYTAAALDILLLLRVAEEEARCLAVHEIELPGAPSAMVTQRWLAALIAQGLVDRRGELIALSEQGYALIDSIVESIQAAKRPLD